MEKEKEDNTKLVNGLLDTLQLEGTYEKITRLNVLSSLQILVLICFYYAVLANNRIPCCTIYLTIFNANLVFIVLNSSGYP